MSDLYNITLLNNILNEFQNGNQEQAYKKLENYLLNNQKDYKAMYNFALMSETLGKIKTAIENYKIVNKKDKNNWRSRFNLYLIYIKSKNYEIALKLVNEVLNLKPNYQPALRDKALIFYYTGKPDRGLDLIKESIKINQKDYIALNTLGLILGSLKQHKEAVNIFENAIKVNANYFPSYNNLGNCLNLLKKQDLALENFKKALKLNPNFQEAINNIANIYSIKGKYQEAIEYYNEALKKGGDVAKIYYNIGVAYVYLNNLQKAEEYYSKSFNKNPNDEILKKNYSILFLAQQNFKKAWELFDGRLNLDDFVLKNSTIENIRHKLLKNEKINKDEKILIIKEQGIGDEIIYGSMYPDLLKNYPNCVIETEERLLSIFKRSFGNEKNFIPFKKFSSNKKDIKKFNKILYAGSLGKLFRNNISDFKQKKFLHPQKDLKEKIRIKLSKIDEKIKIGIAWKSKREILGADKSVDLEMLSEIINLNNISFINLQYGDTVNEVNKFNKKNKNKIHNIKDVDLFNDFESIAALLCNLDLFITVSNSTAHLAGALGIDTWLMKPKNHALFHYWNQPNNKTPWYPSITLFDNNNNWIKTISKIKELLIKKFNIKN